MISRPLFLVLALFVAVSARLPARSAAQPPVAATPPMGWNSWDAYGLTIDEAQFKANATVLSTLKPFGWTFAVVDEGWYLANPYTDKLEARGYLVDDQGRLAPVLSRFPSAADGHGLKALADWTHAKGLRFGLHIVRGIPKQAVARNLPIEGSAYHAGDAADMAATCPWDAGNYGIADNPAGQAYYDALLRQYAGWGVDFLKVDCIADHPYRPTEMRQIGEAIRKTGRPIVLSLSPGPARLENEAAMARYAQMWRIADDLWDGWTFPHDAAAGGDQADAFPNGILSAFRNLAIWEHYSGPGRWPDADMLPFGALRPHPGWGEPRQSRLTTDEARTAFTLWSIAHSPLILGGDLTAIDASERAMLTNRDIIALNQRAGRSASVSLPASLGDLRVWTSTAQGKAQPDTVAVFNVADHAREISATWADLGMPTGMFAARELWSADRRPAAAQIRFTVPAHGVTVWRLRRR